MSPLEDNHRLVIVTGKGGVGKSLLAAALAKASVAHGRSTILVTLDTRDERHPLIDVPLVYQPRRTDHGFSVSRVDAFQAAAEYARRSMPFGAMYETFFKSRTFHDFAAAAPGFEELMCLGKLYQLAVESEFDRVVFDAPSTGHLRDLLAVPAVTQRAVRVGPLNHSARRIEDLLLDPDRTRLLVAALAEEMPVSEALETLALCRDEMRMGCGPVLVNRWIPRRFSDDEMRAMEDLALQRALGLPAQSAVAVARDEVAECASQRHSLVRLEAANVRTVEIPRIAQRVYDGDALLEEAVKHVAPVLGAGVGATSRSRSPSVGATSRSRSLSEPSRPGGRSHTTGGRSHERLEWPRLEFAELIRNQRVIVCCGSGGVGKTTSAAALGVLAAQAGLKVQVMTIDPARRLAQAMGLDVLGHEPQPVPLDAPGELSAMMLDSKRAFDRLVEAYAPDARVREAIFANEYYRQLSSSLAGSRELVAMERVLEVASAGRYDLLIVDTPPSQHALDFLDAPERIISLLDGSMTHWLLRPYGLAARAQFNLFRQSSAVALRFMERFTGVQMLADLSDFLLSFSSMFDGFKERSHRVQALMRDPATAFLLVCAPEPASLSQVGQFTRRLEREHMKIAGVLANRVHPAPAGVESVADGGRVLPIPSADLAALAEAGDPAFSDLPLPDRLTEAWLEAVDLHLADREALALQGGTLPLHSIPRLTHDLHSMADLEIFAALLAGDQPNME